MSLLKQKENVVTWVTLAHASGQGNKRQLVLGKIGACKGSLAVRLGNLATSKKVPYPN